MIDSAAPMTTSIPNAFGATGLWFGVAYFGVQALVLLAQGSYTSGEHRVAFVRYASFASVAPATVLVGALRAAGGEWTIDPVHFSERHALFVIIGLGEVLVTAGAAATQAGLHRHTAIAMTVAVAVACTMWWTYFAFIPDVGEHALRRHAGSSRGRLARDVFTFGHFPIAFGIILYAVVVRHLVDHPVGRMTVDDRWLLGLSVAAVVGGLLAIQYRVARGLAPERIVAILVAAGVCVLGAVLQGTVVVSLVAIVYGAMQAITWRRIVSRGSSRR